MRTILQSTRSSSIRGAADNARHIAAPKFTHPAGVQDRVSEICVNCGRRVNHLQKYCGKRDCDEQAANPFSSTDSRSMNEKPNRIILPEERAAELSEAASRVKAVTDYTTNGTTPTLSAAIILTNAYDAIRAAERVGADEVLDQQTTEQLSRLHCEVSAAAMSVQETWARHAVDTLERWAKTREGQASITIHTELQRNNWWFSYRNAGEIPRQVKIAEDAVEAAAIARQAVMPVRPIPQFNPDGSFRETQFPPDIDNSIDGLKDRLMRMTLHLPTVHDGVYSPPLVARYCAAQRDRIANATLVDFQI